jgi:hypothetical protein
MSVSVETIVKPNKKLPLLRMVFSFPVMLTVGLLAIVWALSSGKANDPDIWWHLRNAEYLFQTHQLPNQDTYSFTVAGKDWMNYEWLTEIPFYLAWRASGMAGVNLLWMLVVQGIFVGLLYLSYRASRNFKASVLACGFCSFLAVVSFGPRTILFGYVLMVLLLIILERFRSTGGGPLWLLPLLFCIWVNAHGSWLIGLIVFGIIGAAGLVEGRWGRIEGSRWTPAQFRKLVFAGVASVAALFINPFGWRMVIYPFEFAAKQKLNVAHIAEWVSVDFHNTRGKFVLVLLIALLIAAVFRNRPWQLTELCLLLFALYCGLTYIRFLFFLGLIAAPILARLLDFVPPYDPEIDKPILNVLFIGGLLFWATYSYPVATERRLEESLAQTYPAQIVPYLQSHPPNGPVLNAYLWGGYLIWHNRDLKVFIDSRVDIYEYSGVFADYLDLAGLKNPQQILEKYQIRYVLFPPDEPLHYVLEHNPDWKIDYRDEICTLFERTERGSLPLTASH